MRINKFLASCGVSSRRGCEQFILNGQVTVNGKVITDLSYKVQLDDVVKFNGKILNPEFRKVYIMMNKPAGYVTTCDDQFGRKIVLDLIGELDVRVFPVGRLDYDTQGLLLLTNNGEFSKVVMQPRSKIPKTYVVELNRAITQAELDRVCAGVVIDGCTTLPAKAVFINTKTVELIITEGRNRQVRKMFETVGINVTNLKRIAIGKLQLGKLKTGEWKFIEYSLLAKTLLHSSDS